MSLTLPGVIASAHVTASAFVPTSITGCVLWLDADDATQFTYSSGVVVSQWADKSGLAHHASQGTVGNQPTRQTAIVNSRAVVRFGSGGFRSLSMTAFASSYTSGELFIVVKNVDETGDGGLHSGWDTSGSFAHYPYAPDGNIYDTWGSTNRKTVGNPTPSLAAWRLYNVRNAASAWSAHLDGTSLFSTSSNTVSYHSSAAYLIGASGLSARQCDMAEVIAYNNVIGSTDRTSLHSYIATKYALTIA